MPVKPFWAAFRALLESAGCDLAPVRQEPGVFIKPTIIVRFGAAVASDVGAAVVPALAGSDGGAECFSHSRANAIKRVSKALKGRAVGEWYCPGGVLGARAWVARDPFLAPDAIQIDMVVGGRVLRDVKPTSYAMGEFLRTVNYYVNEATK